MKLTRNGKTFETQNNHYGYYEDVPCMIVDLHGDYDSWRSRDMILLHSRRLNDGWVRYWLSSSDREMRESLAELAMPHKIE